MVIVVLIWLFVGGILVQGVVALRMRLIRLVVVGVVVLFGRDGIIVACVFVGVLRGRWLMLFVGIVMAK